MGIHHHELIFLLCFLDGILVALRLTWSRRLGQCLLRLDIPIDFRLVRTNWTKWEVYSQVKFIWERLMDVSRLESTGASFTCNWLARKLRNILDFYMHPFSKEPSIRVGIELSQYVPSKDARSMSLTFSASAFWLLHPFPVEAVYMTSLSSSICNHQDAKHQEPLRVLSLQICNALQYMAICKVSS